MALTLSIYVLSDATDRLYHEMLGSMRHAYADSTWRNLNTQHRSFLQFCTEFHRTPLPASLTTVQLYCQYLSRTFRSVTSISNYLNGVKVLHLWHGLNVDHFNHFSLTLLRRGLARDLHHMPRQSHPIDLDILLDIYQQLDLSCSQDLVMWSLLLLAFFLMARKSNLVPNSKYTFDPQKQLTRADIKLHPKMLLVTLKWSKTNQFGNYLHRVPIMAIPHSPLCPVTAYHRLFSSIILPDSAPVFVAPHKGSWAPMSYSQYQNRLRKVIAATGRNPSYYSTHSLRRGGATFAYKAGLSKEHIKLIGDWKSEAVDQYIKLDMQSKLHAAHAIKTYCVHLTKS